MSNVVSPSVNIIIHYNINALVKVFSRIVRVVTRDVRLCLLLTDVRMLCVKQAADSGARCKDALCETGSRQWGQM